MKPRTLARCYRWEATCALIGARLAVSLFSTKRLLAWADKPPKTINRFVAYEANLVAVMVERVGTSPWIKANCLPRALAAQWMLRRRGVASKLCLGVSKEAQELSAHAWIELDQAMVVGGTDAPRYVKLIEFGQQTAAQGQR